jgi:hypothetical protein
MGVWALKGYGLNAGDESVFVIDGPEKLLIDAR